MLNFFVSNELKQRRRAVLGRVESALDCSWYIAGIRDAFTEAAKGFSHVRVVAADVG